MLAPESLREHYFFDGKKAAKMVATAINRGSTLNASEKSIKVSRNPIKGWAIGAMATHNILVKPIEVPR